MPNESFFFFIYINKLNLKRITALAEEFESHLDFRELPSNVNEVCVYFLREIRCTLSKQINKLPNIGKEIYLIIF